MKKINIEEIGNEVNILSSYINVYEQYYLDLFNEIKNSSLLWNDGHSTIFYKKIEEEIKSNNQLFNEIKDSYKIKNFIFDNYKTLGKVIYFDFERARDIVICYDKIIDKLNNYYNLIKGMDYTFYNSVELRMINDILNSFNKIIKDMQISKNNTIKVINKINEIELQVKEMLNNMGLVNVLSFKMDNMYS